AAEGGFTSYPERIDGRKIRARSKSFFDHFSQARLFYHSQSEPEQNHMIDAFSFELGKVKTVEVRERMIAILSQIDESLAAAVAYALGLSIPKDTGQLLNHSIPADADPKEYQPIPAVSSLAKSEALSMANTRKDTIETRKIAVLAADGVDDISLNAVRADLEGAGAVVEIIAPRQGFLRSENGVEIAVHHSLLTAASVLYDAVYVPGGTN